MKKRKLIEEHYAILKKEYDLPSLRDVETGLDYVARELPVIRQFLIFMFDEVQNISGHLFSSIQPNHVISEVEYGFYGEQERKKLGKKHAELMSFAHELLSGLYSEENEQARIFKESYEKFVKLKRYGKDMASFHAKKWLETDKGEKRESRHFG